MDSCLFLIGLAGFFALFRFLLSSESVSESRKWIFLSGLIVILGSSFFVQLSSKGLETTDFDDGVNFAIFDFLANWVVNTLWLSNENFELLEVLQLPTDGGMPAGKEDKFIYTEMQKILKKCIGTTMLYILSMHK
jgi:hypothetical protein